MKVNQQKIVIFLILNLNLGWSTSGAMLLQTVRVLSAMTMEQRLMALNGAIFGDRPRNNRRKKK